MYDTLPFELKGRNIIATADINAPHINIRNTFKKDTNFYFTIFEIALKVSVPETSSNSNSIDS